jgi:hypothetical protein
MRRRSSLEPQDEDAHAHHDDPQPFPGVGSLVKKDDREERDYPSVTLTS